MGGIVVVLLHEHGMFAVRKKICACIGFGRRMDLVSTCMGSVGHMV